MKTAIEQVLHLAQQKGLTLDVLAVEKKSTAIGFQKRKLDQFSLSDTRQLGVRVLDGHHEGIAYTENLNPESLKQMLLDAQANARMIAHEWATTLPKSLTSATPIPGLFDPSLDSISMEEKIQAAANLESEALDFDSRISSVAYSRYADSISSVWIANSNGRMDSYKVSSIVAYAHCLAQNTTGPVMAGEVAAHRNFDQLDTKALARKAAQKTIDRLGAERPLTGRYSVVFENRTAESLVDLIGSYFSAKAVDEKTSPLAGKLGQDVFSPAFHLEDDPFMSTGSGSRPFDDEGHPSQKTQLVEAGKLSQFLTNSVLADKLKLKHTASASRSPSSEMGISVSNLSVRPGSHAFDSLVGVDQKVILITNLMGLAGFRSASGDFSIPVEGFLYENGKRTQPLKDFLISGNIVQLFKQIEAVGNDVLPPIGNSICPSFLVRDLNVSGRS